MPNEPQKTDKQIRDEIVSKAMVKIRDRKSPTEPPRKDLVIEARAWCESSDAMLDEPMRQRLAQLCDEVERLRKQIKTMQRDAREDAQAAANEARWQERQGEDYGSY